MYIEVEISADAELVEQLIGILSHIGFEGFWEDGSLLKCYISSDRWSPAMLEEVHTTVNRMVHTSSTPRPTIAVRNVENRNWNEEWKKTIEPIQVTDRIVIRPTWQDYSPLPGQIVVTIDPKMSFGTGYHETTRLVLRLMEKHVKSGMSLLDVGTGTGVLAIVGVKLGATSAVGVDVDEWSFENAMENVRLNHVEDRIRIVHGELSSVHDNNFDIIVANIQLNVIAVLLSTMKEKLRAGGILMLSGLLLPDREQILKSLSGSKFEICEEATENEWIAVIARS